MSEEKKSFQPWNLILIVVCVVGFSGGVYLLNTTINTRFDSVDLAVSGGLDKTAMTLDRMDDKLGSLKESIKALEAKLAAPPPPPPAPVDPAAAPADATAPAPAAPAPPPAPAAPAPAPAPKE
jgi:hypothetical protein